MIIPFLKKLNQRNIKHLENSYNSLFIVFILLSILLLLEFIIKFIVGKIILTLIIGPILEEAIRSISILFNTYIMVNYFIFFNIIEFFSYVNHISDIYSRCIVILLHLTFMIIQFICFKFNKYIPGLIITIILHITWNFLAFYGFIKI